MKNHNEGSRQKMKARQGGLAAALLAAAFATVTFADGVVYQNDFATRTSADAVPYGGA